MTDRPRKLDDDEFATSDREAGERYQRWQDKDPFPEVECSLLISADIHDYVRKTGMLYPFRESDLKSASYALRLLGPCMRWDSDEGPVVVQDLKEGEEFRLPRNSIAFVTLEPMWRLPSYIAGRFNLKIDNVYRGLLLGTGPLVDPGWCGHLSFPLHNLTSRDYVFTGGETLVWVEFTKTSRIEPAMVDGAARRTDSGRRAKLRPYPAEKVNLTETVRDRLNRAVGAGHGVASSLGATLEETRAQATSAQRSAERAARIAQRWQVVLTAGALLAAIAAGIAVYQLWQDVRGFIADNQQRIVDYCTERRTRDEDAVREVTQKQVEFAQKQAELALRVDNGIGAANAEVRRLEERISDGGRMGDTVRALERKLDDLERAIREGKGK